MWENRHKWRKTSRRHCIQTGQKSILLSQIFNSGVITLKPPRYHQYIGTPNISNLSFILSNFQFLHILPYISANAIFCFVGEKVSPVYKHGGFAHSWVSRGWNTHHNTLKPPRDHQYIGTPNIRKENIKFANFVKNAVLAVVLKQNLKDSLSKYAWKFFFKKISKSDLIMGCMVRFRKLNNLKVLWRHYLAISTEESLDSFKTGVNVPQEYILPKDTFESLQW